MSVHLAVELSQHIIIRSDNWLQGFGVCTVVYITPTIAPLIPKKKSDKPNMIVGVGLVWNFFGVGSIRIVAL